MTACRVNKEMIFFSWDAGFEHRRCWLMLRQGGAFHSVSISVSV